MGRQTSKNNQLIGLRDVPLSRIEDETLGLREYADALTLFAQQCDTPMTIALQGDWGSGKTSLMNMIKENFASNNIKCIWFNTWQYSQFNMQDTLAISLISRFVRELSSEKENNVGKSILNFLSKTAKFGAVFAASYVTGDSKSVREAMEAAGSPGFDDPSENIKELKEKLEDLVVNHVNEERIVVFIDDLDRLVPIKAVELLENLKLFLDLTKCVFFLACDYRVVMQGLKDKFGVSEAELKGKSFFDKIIQVPFNMPLTQYNVDGYIKYLLDRIGVQYTTEDIADYRDLISNSVGFNPRSLKRLFNSLLLLQIVAKRKKVFEIASARADANEIIRILFAIQCLQYSYEPFHRYLTQRSELSDYTFDKLRDAELLRDSEEFAEIRKEMSLGDGLAEYQRISAFFDAFYKAVQLVSDVGEKAASTFTVQEGEVLRALLTFSSVVSTSGGLGINERGERYRNRNMVKELIEELNSNLKNDLHALQETLDGDGFRIYQKKSVGDSGASAYLYSRKMDFGIEMVYTNKEAKIIVYTRKKKRVEGLTEWLFAHLPDDIDSPTAEQDGKSYIIDHIAFVPEQGWDERVNLYKINARKYASWFVKALIVENNN